MNDSNAERLFELVEWFNHFSEQLYSLFTKISNMLRKELKFKEVKRYAQYYTVSPWISEVFHMGLVRSSKYSLDVMVVFQKDRLTHASYKKIPSIIIAKINGGEGSFSSKYWELFDEDNPEIKRPKDGIIVGSFKKGGKRGFKAFQIDLEIFNTKKADEVIYKEILPKVKKILN